MGRVSAILVTSMSYTRSIIDVIIQRILNITSRLYEQAGD